MSGIINELNIIPVGSKPNRFLFSREIKALVGLLLLVFYSQFFAAPAQAATYSFMNIPFAWDTPSGAATTVAWSGLCTNYPGGDDEYSLVNFPGGFTFTFAGTAYSQVRIMSNGMVQFGAADQGIHRDYTPVALPAPANTNGTPGGCSNLAPTNLLQMYWLDINTAPNIAGALVKYELLGSSPNRRFVITYNNVALYGNPATRYTFQVVLRESAAGVNGNFEYRYTSGASTGTGATVGVQVGAADFTQYAFNQAFIDTTNGTNILWYPQTTLASAAAIYHFDEALWDGTAGQVIDSSGNLPATNATSVGTANTGATTKCGSGRSGNFPANTLNTVINAVATPLTLSNSGSVDFWYRSNVAWNSGTAAMLFDATTVATRPFYLMRTATGALQFTISDSAAVIRTTTSAAQAFAANTWQHVGVSWVFLTGTNQTYVQIFLNGVLLTSARYTTTGTIAALSTLYIGDNRTSGVTPSAGTPNSANGLIDEVKVYTAQINAYQAAADMSCTALIDHLLIQSSGSGLTCAASTLTVVACQNAACTVNYTAGVTGTFSASGPPPTVNWDGTTGGAAGAGFATGGSGTAAKNMQVATAGTVTFGITSPTPVPTNATVCNFGTNAPANNNCVFTASSAGFIFSSTITGNSYTIPAQVSGIATAANALYLRALQASTTNPAVCTPAIISSTTSVNMGYTCNNPAICLAGNLATINATAIAPAGTAVSLAFDANGSAPITVRYDDAGQITLNSTATVIPFGGATAVTLNGSSNAFVVAPHHFSFSAIPAAPIKAGNNFSTTVTAYNGLATPTATGNFGKETPAQGVILTQTLVQPAGAGASPGALTAPTFTAYSGGSTTATTSWSEVGLITLTATIANYLSSGLSATGISTNIGQFIPDHFNTVATQGCVAGSYTYSGQPFTVQVSAMNGATPTPAVTQNYDGTVNTSPNFSNTVTLSDASGGGVGTLAPASAPLTTFNAGVAPVTLAYTFTSRTTVPTLITLRAAYTNAAPAYTVTSSGFTEGTSTIRSGRARFNNAHGSEILALPVPFRTEYWNSGWVINASDSCTGDATLGAANAVSVALTPPGAWAVGVACVQDSGSPGLSGAGCAAAGPAVQKYKEGATPTIGFAGNFNFWLKAPGAGNTGAVTMTGSVPTWLQFPWGGGAAINPTARATFGVYKGANEFIYLRENY